MPSALRHNPTWSRRLSRTPLFSFCRTPLIYFCLGTLRRCAMCNWTFTCKRTFVEVSDPFRSWCWHLSSATRVVFVVSRISTALRIVSRTAMGTPAFLAFLWYPMSRQGLLWCRSDLIRQHAGDDRSEIMPWRQVLGTVSPMMDWRMLGIGKMPF